MDSKEQDLIAEEWQKLVGEEEYESAYQFVLRGIRESKLQNDQKKLDWYARFLRGTTVLVESHFDAASSKPKQSAKISCGFCVGGEEKVLLAGADAMICKDCSENVQQYFEKDKRI